MKKNETTEKLMKFSEGAVANLTDAALFCTFYGLEVAFCGSPTSSAVWKAAARANKDLKELNYKSIKRAFSYLRRKGLIKTVKEKTYYIPKITKAGLIRLNSLFPIYDEERVWDGKFYMVTYDIPITKNKDRNILREYLKKLGAAALQDSTYISPYNMRETLYGFIEDRGLHGQILISELDKNGSIGDETFEEVIERVYGLRKLNSEYKDFIKEYKNIGNVSSSRIAFHFMSILQDDPQLPFEILPEWWVGDDAYKLFKSKVKNIGNSLEEAFKILEEKGLS